MPCYRCAARQTDPVRGASPWKRGVISGEQVLVCPECQQAHDWLADLDRCTSCGSTNLVRALGATHCRRCGADEALAGTPTAVAPQAAGPLAGEVAAALDRVLGRDRQES